jgi:UTP:GlnB (protein PII) uridylyltransferase
MKFNDLLPYLINKELFHTIVLMKIDGTLEKELPEVFALIDTPERESYHPEGTTFRHTLLALKCVDSLPSYSSVYGLSYMNWCILCHDLGKALTPKDILPKHIGHERRGLDVIDALCDRLEVPQDYRETAILCCKNHMRFNLVTQMKPVKIYNMVKEVTKNFTDDQMLLLLSLVCLCDVSGRGKIFEDQIKNTLDCGVIALVVLGEVKKLRTLAIYADNEQKLLSELSKSVSSLKAELKKKLDNCNVPC